MKKLIYLLILAPSFLMAGINTEEETIKQVGTAETVSISTSAWTACPGTQTRDDQAGIYATNASTSPMVGILSNGTPSEATTIRPLRFAANEQQFINTSDAINLYLLSLHTSAQNAHCQEVRK